MQFHGADRWRLKYPLLHSLTRLYELGEQIHYLITALFILLWAVTTRWYYCDTFRTAQYNCTEKGPQLKELQPCDEFLPLLPELYRFSQVPLVGVCWTLAYILAGDAVVMKLFAETDRII